MALLIDTAVVPARERMEFWSESSFDTYLPVQIRSAESERFAARMWGYDLGPLTLFRLAAEANTMIRTSRTISACDPECLHLCVVLRGRLDGAQEGRTGVAETGDVISYETSHPVVFRADQPFESLVLRIPRQMLGRHATQIESLTAERICGSAGVPRVAASFLCRLARRLESGSLGAGEATETVDRALDLVHALYVHRDAAHRPKRPRSRAEILLSIESFIEQNLGDPELDPEEIARGTFISRRYLHKLFEAEGTSVCEWIRATRLERCRRDLLDPALGHQTILSIASRWGLPGPQHFTRVFRAAYGCSPREYRRDARRDPGRAPAPASVRIAAP